MASLAVTKSELRYPSRGDFNLWRIIYSEPVESYGAILRPFSVSCFLPIILLLCKHK